MVDAAGEYGEGEGRVHAEVEQHVAALTADTDVAAGVCVLEPPAPDHVCPYPPTYGSQLGYGYTEQAFAYSHLHNCTLARVRLDAGLPSHGPSLTLVEMGWEQHSRTHRTLR